VAAGGAGAAANNADRRISRRWYARDVGKPAAFRKGLAETGYVEGRNLSIEFRFAQNELSRLPELAVDLVRRRPVVIATPSSAAATLAAKAETTTIPIVFSTGADPVQTGLVASLNRPGGNVTGVNNMSGELGAKQLGLLHGSHALCRARQSEQSASR
jgi:ABC-type uncharacterized transport system substrate-binding protein